MYICTLYIQFSLFRPNNVCMIKLGHMSAAYVQFSHLKPVSLHSLRLFLA